MEQYTEKHLKYLNDPQSKPAELLSSIPAEELSKLMEAHWEALPLTDEKPLTHLLPDIRRRINRNQPGRLVRFAKISLAAAASISILLTIGYLWATSTQLYSTTNTIAQIKLKDGSRVTLNQNSQISFPRFFIQSSRAVELKGTAYFQVTRNEHKPFIVRSTNLTTRVLGTSFIITEHDSVCSVKVLTGLVGVTPNVGITATEYKLSKNALLLYNVANRLVTTTTERSANDLSWQTGILEFDDTPADKVARDLLAVYNQQIVLTEELKGIKVTAYFEKQPYTEVIEELALILNAELVIKDNKAYFYQK